MMGKYLKELRLINKLTLREVEKITGISNAYLSQVERGKRSVPTIKILRKLAHVYNVQIYFRFGMMSL